MPTSSRPSPADEELLVLRVVAKRTFLELVEESGGTDNESDAEEVMRCRAHSDPGLCAKHDDETPVREDRTQAMPSYDPVTTPQSRSPRSACSPSSSSTRASGAEAGGASGASACGAQAGAEGEGEGEAEAGCTARWTPVAAGVPPGSWASSAGASAPTPPTQEGAAAAACGDAPGGWQELASLMRENARLALENTMLKQGKVTTAWGEDCAHASLQPTCWLIPLGYNPTSIEVAPMAAHLPARQRQQQQQARRPQHQPQPPWQQEQQQQREGGRGRGGGGGGGAAAPERQRLQQRQAPHLARPGCAGPPIKGDPSERRSTVMLRNVPNNYTREMLLAMLDSEGFGAHYDFIYWPIDFVTQAALGYAFVNLVDASYAAHFWSVFDGYSNWVLPSRKICGVTWSGPHQGLEAHLERYRNSAVMHASVPEHYKPVVFQNGHRIEFPMPSKAPRAPRTRSYAAAAPGRDFATWARLA